MDKAFYDHIKANRASPAFQSVNNPAPDFYGERVCAPYNHCHPTLLSRRPPLGGRVICLLRTNRSLQSGRLIKDIQEVVERPGCLYEKGDARRSRGKVMTKVQEGWRSSSGRDTPLGTG